jgi:hypothetical protein
MMSTRLSDENVQRTFSDHGNKKMVLNDFVGEEQGADEERNNYSLKPGLLDVLSGRGRSCFNHHGNQFLRAMVADKLDFYLTAANREEKTAIAIGIVKAIKDSGGKFLKKHEGAVSGKAKMLKIWFEIKDSEARKKVSHAFRDALSERLNKEKQQATNKEASTKPAITSKTNKKKHATAAPTSRLTAGAGVATKVKSISLTSTADHVASPTFGFAMKVESRSASPSDIVKVESSGCSNKNESIHHHAPSPPPPLFLENSGYYPRPHQEPPASFCDPLCWKSILFLDCEEASTTTSSRCYSPVPLLRSPRIVSPSLSGRNSKFEGNDEDGDYTPSVNNASFEEMSFWSEAAGVSFLAFQEG